MHSGSEALGVEPVDRRRLLPQPSGLEPSLESLSGVRTASNEHGCVDGAVGLPADLGTQAFRSRG